MHYTGEIIRESLRDPSVLDAFKSYLVKTRTATVANFTPSLWHVERYRLPLDQVSLLTARLVNNINNDQWYVHFYSETSDEMHVVLSGRIFKLSKHRDRSWDEMIAYGESVGVGRRWTENIPVDLAP
jgi:hypothetical protein